LWRLILCQGRQNIQSYEMKNHPTSKVNFMCCMVLLQYLRCMQIQARLSQRCWCRKVENMNYPWWKNMWVLRMCLVNSGSPMLCGINSKLLELRTWKTYNHALAVRGTCRRLKEEEASQVSSECRPVQSRFLIICETKRVHWAWSYDDYDPVHAVVGLGQ